MKFVFLLMWEAHYLHRAFIYPFGLRDRWKAMPAAVSLMGAAFDLGNAYLNGRYLFDLSGDRYQADWLTTPQFMIGFVLFIARFVINRHSDAILHGLRKEGGPGYKIPYGGMYRYISCPVLHSPCGPLPTWRPAPVRTTSGITNILKNIPGNAKR